MHWYVLTTRAQWQAELILRNALHRAGVSAFVPVEIQRRWSKVRNEQLPYTTPLYPRYVFAGWPGDPDYDLLRAEKMWVGVLGNSGKPFRLAQATVDAIEIISLMGSVDRRRFSAGDRVRYDMVYAEVKATIDRIEAETATIRFDMFGKEHVARVPEARLLAETA